VPIFKSDEEFEHITQTANQLIAEFKKIGVSVKYDNRTTQKPGFKFAEWELKGVPIRIAIGPKDLENSTLEIARRDTLTKETIERVSCVSYIGDLLEKIQNDLFNKALDFRNEHITEVETFEEFKSVLENKTGFVSAHWDGTVETEEKIKELTKATIRCILLNRKQEIGECVLTRKKSEGRVFFAKAY